MLKLHKLFTYSKHFFVVVIVVVVIVCYRLGREGLLSVWKFTIVYYLVKYSNISAQTHMCPPQCPPRPPRPPPFSPYTHTDAETQEEKGREEGRGEKKYIFFDDFVSATTECHPYPG